MIWYRIDGHTYYTNVVTDEVISSAAIIFHDDDVINCEFEAGCVKVRSSSGFPRERIKHTDKGKAMPHMPSWGNGFQNPHIGALACTTHRLNGSPTIRDVFNIYLKLYCCRPVKSLASMVLDDNAHLYGVIRKNTRIKSRFWRYRLLEGISNTGNMIYRDIDEYYIAKSTYTVYKSFIGVRLYSGCFTWESSALLCRDATKKRIIIGIPNINSTSIVFENTREPYDRLFDEVMRLMKGITIPAKQMDRGMLLIRSKELLFAYIASLQ
jgi:hypothetical protein